MTERRVSQRTGNTETCHREQEGEMEGEIGREEMGGLKRDVNETEREGEYKRGGRTLERQSKTNRRRKYRWRDEDRNKEAEKIKIKIILLWL